MKKVVIFAFTFLLLYSVTLGTALAVCPVCTIAVASGLGLSRFLGIDDTISGIWIGGLILSFGLWLTSYLEKKKIKFRYLRVVSLVAMYLLTILPMWWMGILGHPLNRILGIDKLIFGSLVGSIAFATGVYLDQLARRQKGKQFFNYQRVVFPVVALIIASFIFYMITK